MSTKVTDDIRVLVVLRDGGKVQNFYRAGFKFSRAPEYWCSVDGPGDDKRFRLVSLSSIDRCVDAGMIEVDADRSDGDLTGNVSSWSHDLYYKLTEAGTSAAAALDDVTMDRALAPPKQKPTKPEMTREEKEAAKRLRYARQDLAYLAKGGRLVQTDRYGWICRSMDLPYEPPGRNSWYLSVDRNLPLFRHLTEEFVGIDGLPSLRINAAGAEIIAKRRPLTANITAP